MLIGFSTEGYENHGNKLESQNIKTGWVASTRASPSLNLDLDLEPPKAYSANSDGMSFIAS